MTCKKLHIAEDFDHFAKLRNTSELTDNFAGSRKHWI